MGHDLVVLNFVLSLTVWCACVSSSFVFLFALQLDQTTTTACEKKDALFCSRRMYECVCCVSTHAHCLEQKDERSPHDIDKYLLYMFHLVLLHPALPYH